VRTEAQSVITRATRALRTRWAMRGPEPASSDASLEGLIAARTPEDVARVLLDEAARLVDVPFSALMVVDERGEFAHCLLGRERGADVGWMRDFGFDLRREPSGVSSAVFEAAPFAVYDGATSGRVHAGAVAASGAKSLAYVPITTEGRVTAVLVVAETRRLRAFGGDDLATLARLVARAAPALERARGEESLAAALDRERRVAEVARDLLAAPRVEDALGAALARAGQAVGAFRCVLRRNGHEDVVWVAPGGRAGELPGRLAVPERALHVGTTAVVADVDAESWIDAADRSLQHSLDARAVLAVPLGRDERQGVLWFDRDRPGAWRRASVELAEQVARELGEALSAAGGPTRADERPQGRDSRLLAIATVLGEALGLAAMYDAVAQAAAVGLGDDSAVLLVPSGSGLEPAGSSERLPYTVRAALAEFGIAPAVSLAADEGRVLAAPDLATDDRFDPAWRALVADAGAALLAVPVEIPRTARRGVVLVFSREPTAYADDDLEVVRELASAARRALERADLFEAERASRVLVQQLARTGGALATELDPDAVLEEVAREARALLGADAAAIALVDEDRLRVEAASGDHAAGALGAPLPVTGSLAGDVAQSRSPVVVETIEADRRPPEGDPLLLAGHVAYLGVPLVGPEGALHGVLAVYGKGARAWHAEEVEALLALAANTSAALSNAEVYQRVALEKERSFAILANIADGIVAVDRDGEVVLWNAAAEQITGVPAAEALGRTPLQVLGRRLESDGEAVLGDRPVSIARGDEEVWLSLTEAVMRDPAGAVAGRIFAFRDISTDRLVEQMKSEFVSTVSQELRRPLTSIYGFAETLLRQDVLFDQDERRIFLGYIASESERLTAIVDKLLNVARLETGDLLVSIERVDVRDVLDEVVSEVRAGAGANGHEFVLDVPSDPLQAEADPDKVRQVVQSLVENAVRYSPEGGTVTIAARRGSDAIEVRVVDEGIGIPRAEQERIFRKFYRADAVAHGGSGGTGLGLFIARGLVSAMGGRIWVDSTEGEGSSFGFALPLPRA
jgi:PAS domain S-box-containing protein